MPPGGVCHDLWGAEFVGSPCHNRQVELWKYTTFFKHLFVDNIKIMLN